MSKFKPDARMAAVIANARPAREFTTGTAVAPPPAAIPQQEDEISPASVAFRTSAQKFALNSALVFFFFRISFLHEYISGHIGLDTHMMIITGGICYLACFISGKAGTALRDRCTWMWIAFAFWMTLATAFSTWRGGSLPQLEDYLKTILPIIFIIPAAVHTSEDVNKFMGVIGIAGIINVALGFVSSDFRAGRMNLEAAGSIADPNDYASHLIFLIPAIAYYSFSLKKAKIYRIVGVGAVLAALYQILSTGSRGGLVSLIAFAAYVAFTGNTKVKIGLLLGGPTLVLLALPLVPQSSLDRLKTLFVTPPANEQKEAQDSTDARRALLQASIKATWQHPILGIGPDVFEDYEAGMAADQGHRGMWHGTHNAYTQISCECGIPALLFVLAGLAYTSSYLRKVKKNGDLALQGAATTLSVMLFGFTVCIIFLTKGYNFNFLVISGLAIAMKRMLPDAEPA